MKTANSIDFFALHKKEIKELCERHQVKTLYAFWGRSWGVIFMYPVILTFWLILKK